MKKDDVEGLESFKVMSKLHEGRKIRTSFEKFITAIHRTDLIIQEILSVSAFQYIKYLTLHGVRNELSFILIFEFNTYVLSTVDVEHFHLL